MPSLITDLESVLATAISDVFHGLHIQRVYADASGDLGVGEGSLAVLQDFDGDLRGNFAAAARPETATELYAHMTGIQLGDGDGESRLDLLGEILNMVSGHCQKLLRDQELRIRISTPKDMHTVTEVPQFEDVAYILIGVQLNEPGRRVVFRLMTGR